MCNQKKNDFDAQAESSSVQWPPLISPTVPARIISLHDAVQHHHWCFPFSVDGNPEPSITWLYNGKELIRTPYAYTKYLSDASDGSVKHGCLSLNKPTHFNNGVYTLIAENRLGSDNATATGTFMENPFMDNPEGVFPGENLTAASSFFALPCVQSWIQKCFTQTGFFFSIVVVKVFIWLRMWGRYLSLIVHSY